MARIVMCMQARTHDREEEKERHELKKNTLQAMLKSNGKGQREAQASERKKNDGGNNIIHQQGIKEDLIEK